MIAYQNANNINKFSVSAVLVA